MRPARPLPKMGAARFVVVADSDEAGLAIARRAYLMWYRSFNYLFWKHNTTPGVLGERPPTFDGHIAKGTGIAGSPKTVADVLARQIADTGANYLVCQFAFVRPAARNRDPERFAPEDETEVPARPQHPRARVKSSANLS